MNDYSNLSFLKRLYIYQKERFPLLLNLVSVSVFTFSAVSYSIICGGNSDFITIKDFVVGVFVTYTLFMLVRIFDEHKDRVEDAKFRSYLPVPRGVVSLSELRNVGILIGVLQITAILVFQPSMIWLQLMVLAYLSLMAVEFFVPKYLKSRQILYITSHMFIIPLIDIYSSGLDWNLKGESPHIGLLFFFVVSYMNGLVLEFGRKMRSKENEEVGVVSYTGLYGLKRATIYWMLLLFVTYLSAVLAANFVGYGMQGFLVLTVLFGLCVVPGFLFINKKDRKSSKLIEISSGIWTVAMYLSLGAIPMLENFFN
ncbi:UbiA family prenyltransferase [Owenweeksia hongkongensis]|uniref:UbiA family prenyltransferase n=1 Tax=Owenweeksia hongkongensis TaxID=253245 RepID=UPI003A942BF7